MIPAPPKRILIVNVNWIGDVLFSTPAIRAVRAHAPSAHIACLAAPRTLGLLRNNPHLNELIELEDRLPVWRLPLMLKAVARLKESAFDEAIFLSRSNTRAYLTFLAGIPKRHGFKPPYGNRCLTHAYEGPEKSMHRTDEFLLLLERMGIASKGRSPEFVPSLSSEQELKKLLAAEGILQGERYVVVHAGGNWELKRWPPIYFIEWIKRFIASTNGKFKVVLCGTGAEFSLVNAIHSALQGDQVMSLCGKTSLDTLARLLAGSEFLLSNDSGPIHLAASQGTRILGLFGPTSPAMTGPVSSAPLSIIHGEVGCEVPCYFRSCSYRLCMESITPDKVLNEALELVSR